MAAILGMNCKLYYQTTGTREAWPGTGAAPNLSLITNVKDLTLDLSANEIDATTRANGGWEAVLAGLKKGTVDFDMVTDASDTPFTALQTAFLAGTTVGFAVLNGVSTVTGTQGLWADFQITNFSQEQNLDGVVTTKVTIRPAYSAVAPAWITVVAA